jgi:hypothetical protein
MKGGLGACFVMRKEKGSPVLEVRTEGTVYSAAIQPAEYNEVLKLCLDLQRIERDAVIVNRK